MVTNHVIAIRNYDGLDYSKNNNSIPVDVTLNGVREILRDIRKPTPIIRYPIQSSRETEALVESIRKSIFADKNSSNANGILSNPPNDRQLRDDINQFFTPSNVLILVVGLQWRWCT